MSILRDAYQAIIDRVEGDSQVRTLFSQFHKSSVTEVKNHPYLRIGLANVEMRPITTMGTNISNEAQLDLSVTIEVESDDEDIVTKELLRAIEVFTNALEGTDITYNQKYQGNILISFTEFETLFSGESKIFKSDGLITHTIQPYSGGTL